MGFFGSGFGLVLVLWTYGLGSIVCAVQDYWDDPAHLHCGSDAMEFTLPSVLDDAAFALAVIDENSTSHYFRNDSACGTWIGQRSDSSMVIGSAFDGCYVREENDAYMMTITLQESRNDGTYQYNKKDLACAILQSLPAMDAPSPSICASVQPGDRLQCANNSVSRDLCEGLGCCFSQNDVSMRCFYGKTLTAYCSDDNNMVVVISKDLTVPPLILSSVQSDVNSNSCPTMNVASTASFIGYQIPLSCVNVNQVAGPSMGYQHSFEATQSISTWQTGSITRDSTMRVTVSCSYYQTSIVPLQVEVVTLPPPLPVSTSGPLLLEMRIAQDQQYTTYYADQDYPIVRILRDPVYTEVRILQRTDPSLILVLNDCWATNSPMPTSLPQWPILVNGCPFQGDNYLTQPLSVGPPTSAVPFPTQYMRFVVSTFTFVDQSTQTALDGLVFFQCSASVCVPSATESCAVNCAQRRKRAAESLAPEALTTVSSQGPVIFYSEETGADEVLNEEEGPIGVELALAWLQGAAAAGFILMVSILGFYLYKRQRKCAVSTISA